MGEYELSGMSGLRKTDPCFRGESHLDEEAAAQNIPVLAKIPIQPSIAQAVDGGRVEYLDMPWS